MKKPISAAEYLAVTLRFLATGESYSTLEFQFRISKSTLSNMIPFVCKVICTVLKDDHLACPQSELEWLNIAKQFQDRWQLPNCLGAGDGKHIRLLCPSNSGSEYYNYKGYYSLVLMAFVGPEYQFLFVDVGCQGNVSDGGVFHRTSLWKALEGATASIFHKQNHCHKIQIQSLKTPVIQTWNTFLFVTMHFHWDFI